MVERRDHVLMACARPLVPRAASAFLRRYPSTNGPFHTERVTVYLLLRLLAVMTRPHDELLGPLVGAGLGALRRLAPGRCPVLAAVGTAAVRVVDRVACDTARDRALALPAV